MRTHRIFTLHEDADIEVLALVRAERLLECWRSGRFAEVSLRPIAVIVRRPDRETIFGIDGSCVGLEQVQREIDRLANPFDRSAATEGE